MLLMDFLKNKNALEILNSRIILIKNDISYRKYVEYSLEKQMTLDPRDIHAIIIIRSQEKQIENSRKLREQVNEKI